MTIDIREFSDVSVVRVPVGEPTRDLGKALFFTADGGNVVSASGSNKIRTYSRFSGVETDFQTTDEPYVFGNRWFQVEPMAQSLVVGRWAQAAVNDQLIGGAPATLSTLTAISDGSFSIGNVDFTGLDLSGAGDYAAVATALETEIRTGTGFTAATVTYSASPSRFIVVFPPGTNAGLLAVHSTPGTGTDASSPLGLDSTSGAVYLAGSAIETMTEGLQAVDELDPSWTFLVLDKAQNDDAVMSEASTYCETHGKIFAGEINAPDASVTNDTTSRAALLYGQTPANTFLTYSEIEDYKAGQAAGLLSGIDFNATRSLITLNLRSLYGVTPDDLSTTQKTELNAKTNQLLRTNKE